jgi:hypothetical protein
MSSIRAVVVDISWPGMLAYSHEKSIILDDSPQQE